MSPRLPVVEAKDLARVARTLGFELDRQKGSHAVFRRESDRARVVIPMHSGKAIRPKTLVGILEDMGITSEQLWHLL
ncbi:MAG: type II toxin-antitoxin system HicA family toxin [Thermoanaerobaculia bacterium]